MSRCCIHRCLEGRKKKEKFIVEHQNVIGFLCPRGYLLSDKGAIVLRAYITVSKNLCFEAWTTKSLKKPWEFSILRDRQLRIIRINRDVPQVYQGHIKTSFWRGVHGRQYPKIGDFKKWKFSFFPWKIIACWWVLAKSQSLYIGDYKNVKIGDNACLWWKKTEFPFFVFSIFRYCLFQDLDWWHPDGLMTTVSVRSRVKFENVQTESTMAGRIVRFRNDCKIPKPHDFFLEMHS